MRMTRLVSASIASIALAVTFGSVSAAGQSAAHDGVAAVPLASTQSVSASGQSAPLDGVAAVPLPSDALVSAFAEFATLAGVKAVPMASRELDAVKGLHVHFRDAGGGEIHLAGDVKHHNNWQNLGGSDGLPVAPSYHGLCVAAGISSTGGISIPGSAVQC